MNFLEWKQMKNNLYGKYAVPIGVGSGWDDLSRREVRLQRSDSPEPHTCFNLSRKEVNDGSLRQEIKQNGLSGTKGRE